jgi:hypothetical protein
MFQSQNKFADGNKQLLEATQTVQNRLVNIHLSPQEVSSILKSQM